MAQVKILIVEDELITATNIEEQLQEAGYGVAGIARTYEEAVALFQETSPDLVLMDIQLEGDKDGIEVAARLNKLRRVPIIYITGSTEDTTLDRAKKTGPAAFVLKPFRTKEFITNVDLVLANTTKKKDAPHTVLSDAVFLPTHNRGHEKVLKKDILYVEGDKNYTTVFTKDNKYMVATHLYKLEKQLDPTDFERASKKHVINLQHLARFDKDVVWIEDKKIPVGESYRKKLKLRLNFIRT